MPATPAARLCGSAERARSGTATFSTEGSDFDTLLGVYKSAPNGGLVTVASSDDVAGATTSRVQFPVTAGDVLLIAIDGRQFTPTTAASGQLRLTVNLPNDNVADALPIHSGAPRDRRQHRGDAPSRRADPLRRHIRLEVRVVPLEPPHDDDRNRASGTTMHFTRSTKARPARSRASTCSPRSAQRPTTRASRPRSASPRHRTAATGSQSTACRMRPTATPTTGVCWYGTTHGSFTVSLTG